MINQKILIVTLILLVSSTFLPSCSILTSSQNIYEIIPQTASISVPGERGTNVLNNLPDWVLADSQTNPKTKSDFVWWTSKSFNAEVEVNINTLD